MGVFLTGILFALTLGSLGPQGMGAAANLAQAEAGPVGDALLSGALFNVANILLVVAIDAAGMSLAFPVGVGLALVIGTVGSYVQTPKGDPALLFTGVTLIVVAMVMSAVAYSKLPKVAGRKLGRGLLFAVIAGSLMGMFYPCWRERSHPNSAPRRSNRDTSLRIPPCSTSDRLAAEQPRCEHDLHEGRRKTLLTVLQWQPAAALPRGSRGPDLDGGSGPERHRLGRRRTRDFLRAGPRRHAGRGDWGVFIWKEFKDAPKGTTPFVALMFLGYACGLTLIGIATL